MCMKKIYIIKFCNGEEYDMEEIADWTFTETEEEAEKLVDELNTQLKIDEYRYKYLRNYNGLLFDERGNFNGSEAAEEFKRLEHKYPLYDMGYYEKPMGWFFYTELEKEEESQQWGSFLCRQYRFAK